MKLVFTEPFKRDYGGLPPDVRRALDKALDFLIADSRHPSLRAKKLPATSIWYARVSRAYRFTFTHERDVVILRRAGTHGILSKERKRQ